MRNWIFALEGINAVLGIAVGINQINQVPELLGLPIGAWFMIVYAIFAIGCFILFWSDKTLENSIYAKVMVSINNGKQAQEKIDLTPHDRIFLEGLSDQMFIQHGHSDSNGLLADFAERVPLNELLNRPCSICRQNRNIKSTIELEKMTKG